MTSIDMLTLHSAVLPFVRPWKELDPELDVVSLDGNVEAWDRLLAGLGVNLLTGLERVPDGCAVATGFTKLDTMPPDALQHLASESLHALGPGGLLILGGVNPLHPEVFTGGLTPAETINILHVSGFARTRLIAPSLDAGDTSLSSALFGLSRQYAIVAQKEAFGRTFDVFSKAFFEAPSNPVEERFKAAENTLLHRVHHGQDVLHSRINKLEGHFTARLRDQQDHTERHNEQTAARLQDQAQEIATLQTQFVALEAKLKRATRRRGLRKLAYDLKRSLRKRRETLSTSSTSDMDADIERPSPSPKATDAAISIDPSTPKRESPPHILDPTPLSPHERERHKRLFSQGSEN